MRNPGTPALQGREHVRKEQQFLAAVEAGKQALREGHVVDHENVAAAFDRLIASTR